MERVLLNILLVSSYLFSDTTEFTVNKYLRDSSVILKRYRRSSGTGSGISCAVPSSIENGRWFLSNGQGITKQKIDKGETLHIQCNEGYKLSSERPNLICDSNWNASNIPVCHKLCPPIYPSKHINIKCINEDYKRVDCARAIEGTVLSYKCAPFYEVPPGYQTNLFCFNGKWNYPEPVCQPVCGRRHVDSSTIPNDGHINETRGKEYPWVTTIYRKQESQYKPICGGSLIGERVVLTAASCVTNENGEISSHQSYYVAAGNSHSNYGDPRDTLALYLQVSRIITPPKYKGYNQGRLADVAILVTSSRFSLSRHIQPVCIKDPVTLQTKPRRTGIVSGWEDKEGRHTMRTTKVHFRNETHCTGGIAKNSRNEINITDKICAAIDNNATNTTVCGGDNGNGLYIKNDEDNRYYIQGVSNIDGLNKKPCDSQQYYLYTNTSFYYSFIKSEVSKIDLETCVLPAHPANGRWETENEDRKPGDVVSSDYLLKISCNQGFRLPSENSSFKCSSKDIPSCDKMCGDFDLGEGFKIRCKNSKGEPISCVEATNLSTLSYKCPRGYEIPSGQGSTIQCMNGAWNSTPECQLIEHPKRVTKPAEVPKVVCIYDSRRYNRGVKPEQFNASLCTHLIYHYAGLSFSGNVVTLDSSTNINGNQSLYEIVMNLKKTNGDLKILLSISGLGINAVDEFPTVASDPAKRSRFVSSINSLLETHKFDGIDIHWHEPSADDKNNFAVLLKELREALRPRGKLLTATVYVAPTYLGYNIGAMNDNLDWANLKCYDHYTEFSKYTGQNSALYPSIIESSYQRDNLNMQACTANWQSYGLNKDKIVAGMTFFGRYYTLVDAKSHGLRAPVTGSTNSNHTGLVSYSEICQEYTNWTRVWDDEQKNPYKYYGDKWVGYDDPDSIKLKAAYVKKDRYGGVAVFSIDADDVQGNCGPKQALLKQVNDILRD